jgi:hypothetical protein
MYRRSYGNVRELMVSGSKEPPNGNGGVQKDRAFPKLRGGKEANTGKWRQHEQEEQLASTIKRRKTKQDGMNHE